MNLRQTVEFVRQLQKEPTLFDIDRVDPTHEELASFFRTQTVRISTAKTASGRPVGLAVLSTEDSLPAIVDVEALRDLVQHSSMAGSLGSRIRRPSTPSQRDDVYVVR